VTSQERLSPLAPRPDHTALTKALETFDDFVDAEVGDTTQQRARNLERETGLRQIYLKFEGGNPTGTQKDRVAFTMVRDALRRGYEAITVATCGNFGAALGYAARIAKVRAVAFVPETFSTRRATEMEATGTHVVRVPGTYEDAVMVSRERAAIHEWYDANPGSENGDLQLEAYAGIAYEIFDELRDAPAAVAVPVSNGTTLAGIHHGFMRLERRGKISRVPRMIGASTYRKNPIVRSFVNNIPECVDLDPAEAKETGINEPLVNWHAFDGQLALDAIRSSGGWAGDATDKAMLTHARLLREREGLDVLPASTSALAVLLKGHAQNPLPPDRYVVVLTGRRG
jgi:threonine synthase